MRRRAGEAAGDSKRRVETDRLILVPVEPPDRAVLHEILVEPEVRRFLLDGQVVAEQWVAAEIERSGELFAALGCGLWTIRQKRRAEIAGLVGFRHFFAPPRLQLLVALHPSCWGRGLATEAARSIIRFAFDRLGFERIEAAADVPNARSVRLMERLGMVFDRRTDDGEAGMVFYVLHPAT